MNLALISSIALLQAGPAPIQTLLESPQFQKKANNNKAAERIYGINTFANPASSVRLAVQSGVLSADFRLANDGAIGYTANAGVMIPLSSDWAEHDLSNLERIRFEYRLDSRISDALSVGIGSGTYQPEHVQQGVIYQSQIRGAGALSAGSTWKTAELDILDFATPSWWIAPVDFPDMRSVLQRANSIHLQPQSLYFQPGTSNGQVCSKCVGPVTPAVRAEFRKIELVRSPARTLSGQFELSAKDSSQARAIYGIAAYSNPASKVEVSVETGVLKSKTTLASEGSNGYSALAGILLPIQPSWEPVDLRNLSRIEFEYRYDNRISDGLRIAFGSNAYTANEVTSGTVYEQSLFQPRIEGSQSTWHLATLEAVDFATPAWWTATADFPSFDQILAQAKNLDISPRTLYSASGTVNGIPCTKCVGPLTQNVTLEVRNLNLVGSEPLPTVGRGILAEAPVPSSHEFAGVERAIAKKNQISSRTGAVELSDPSLWTAIEIVSLDGRQMKTLEPAARMNLDLPNGSYLAVLRGRDGSRMASPIQIMK